MAAVAGIVDAADVEGYGEKEEEEEVSAVVAAVSMAEAPGAQELVGAVPGPVSGMGTSGAEPGSGPPGFIAVPGWGLLLVGSSKPAPTAAVS
ncbi:hypothetical protein UVI_02049060 [Ustilaginoidea virens]|uniref:Uncharacterized protein n=1 Tax=Ustilaginoidea virens TaxID=1159556 RepID=A0A1B5LAG0_USTVR|nr:hypothetical protein UVI_02049060 [Ustilaginoidea virens]